MNATPPRPPGTGLPGAPARRALLALFRRLHVDLCRLASALCPA
ncbi:MAG TPA: putative leader peptide [Thermomonospora sp.]|nr:putative leader peptide [Thermomonospora sp.]